MDQAILDAYRMRLRKYTFNAPRMAILEWARANPATRPDHCERFRPAVYGNSRGGAKWHGPRDAWVEVVESRKRWTDGTDSGLEYVPIVARYKHGWIPGYQIQGGGDDWVTLDMSSAERWQDQPEWLRSYGGARYRQDKEDRMNAARDDAMRTAESMAERAAEEEAEYQEAWREGSNQRANIEDKRDKLRDALATCEYSRAVRRKLRGLLKLRHLWTEYREAARMALSEYREAKRDALLHAEKSREEWHKAWDTMRDARPSFWYGDAKRLREAFDEGFSCR